MDLDAQRHRIRAWRKALPRDFMASCSQAIAKLLPQLPEYTHASRIGAYSASENEIDPQTIIADCWLAGKKAYLPVMSESKQYHIDFYAYNKGQKLKSNPYGITEPETSGDKIEPWKLDLVLLPLVAFDQFCNRIGRGAGFYDRCFAFANELPNSNRPILVGLAYSDQLIDTIPSQPWDVAMDYIITEHGITKKPPAN